jgi:membrane protein
MPASIDRYATIFRAVIHECRVERITFMAGSIAYNAFVSLLPLLFLLLAVVTRVGSGQIEAQLIGLVQSAVTPGAGDVLVSELRQASTGASVLGLAVLVWGMLRIFRSLDMAFSDIYETEAKNTLFNQITDGLVVFVSITVVIFAVASFESTVSLPAGSGLGWLLQRVVLICLVAAALVPIYYLFPDEPDMGVLETIPGILFTASALVVLQSAFSLYVRYSDQMAENGILASILIFMTWLYFSGLMILLGAVINAVLSNRSADVNIDPVIGGVPKRELGDGSGSEPVPMAEIQQLNQHLDQATEVTITFDDGAEVTIPSPDTTTVESDDSPIPGLSNTTTLELCWVRDRQLRGEAEDDSVTVNQ